MTLAHEAGTASEEMFGVVLAPGIFEGLRGIDTNGRGPKGFLKLHTIVSKC